MPPILFSMNDACLLNAEKVQQVPIKTKEFEFIDWVRTLVFAFFLLYLVRIRSKPQLTKLKSSNKNRREVGLDYHLDVEQHLRS